MAQAHMRLGCEPFEQLERAAGFADDDTPQARLDKLDAVLTRTSTSKQEAALFADMLSLPNNGRYPAVDLTPATNL